MTAPHDDPSNSTSQPIFRAPFLALLVAASMPLLFWFQQGLPDFGMGMAFRPTDLEEGHWQGLFTSMLLHGGWMHVLMNAFGALAFGTPIARLFGRSFGPGLFLLFYIASGVVATLGFGMIHYTSDAPLIGASGAVFGLIGASTRLAGPDGMPMGRGQGVVLLLPLFHPLVVRQAMAWIGLNLIIALVGSLPGLGGGEVAWEAHLIGLVFGLVAIGPLARLYVRLARR